MRVQYGDGVLYRLAVDAGFQPGGWGPDVIRSYRRRLQSLVAAKDGEDLRRVMSLDLKSEHGRDGAGCSIRLGDRSRLLLNIDIVETDQVTVLGIVVSDTREVAP